MGKKIFFILGVLSLVFMSCQSSKPRHYKSCSRAAKRYWHQNTW